MYTDSYSGHCNGGTNINITFNQKKVVWYIQGDNSYGYWSGASSSTLRPTQEYEYYEVASY